MSEAQTTGSESGAARDLIVFRQNTSVILVEEPMYGPAIKRHLESYYDTEASHGRLHPNLDDLARMDLIEKSEFDKWMSQYELTDDDLQAVLDRFDWMLAKFVTDDERAEMVSELVENKL